MITLTVVAFNGTPADGTLKVHFDELGGSIGRAETNQLVLPDPERMVSRVAAQVVFRNGGFAIIDRGSNPISLNGRELASGREAALSPGDRVRICGYELAVAAGTATPAPAPDPFANLLGPAPAARSAGAQLVDPLLAKPAGAAPPKTTPPAGGIPMDWDPFAARTTGKPDAAAAPRRDALGLEIGAGAAAPLVPDLNMPSAAPSSIDQLFGLAPGKGGDPLANSPLDAPMAQPNMAADADPMRSLKSAPMASGPAESDQLPDLQRPFIPPTFIKPAAPRRVAPTAGLATSRPDDGRSVLPSAPMAARTVAMPPPAPAEPPTPLAAQPVARAAAAVPVGPVAHAVPTGSGGDAAALLEAFRRGLQAPALELPALTPHLMELVGQLLHESVRGTVDLLRARNTVKRELRAEVTTIVAKNNNPLKFSPDTEVALQHLLAPPARGFIAAAPAMRDAFDDLRIHEFALVAGMQAVLEAALQRFDPAAIEARLGDPTLLQSLLPASRHARLWELFTEHYGRLRGEAKDDFQTLFGDSFLAAYDSHVDRVRERRAQAERAKEPR